MTEIPELYICENKYQANEPQFSFFVLRDYPIIYINEDNYVIPIPRFLLFKFTDELYFLLNEHYSKLEIINNINNPNPYDNQFSQYYGKVFEKYLYMISEELYSKECLISEFEYHIKKNVLRSPDLIIEEDKLIIIEQKNKRFQLNVQKNGDIDQFKYDLKKGVIKALAQSLKFIDKLMINTELQKKIPGFKKEKIYLVVTPEIIPGTEFPPIRKIFNELIQESYKSDLELSIISYLFIDIETSLGR